MQDKEETHLYTCKYCKIEFKPKRRRIQKFCSDNCRSKNWFMVHSKDRPPPIAIESNETAILSKEVKKEGKRKLMKVEEISIQGVGNATLGSIIGNKATDYFTPEEKKPVTNKDFQILKSELLGKYHPITNIDNDEYGRKPYYDIESKEIVYMGFVNPFNK